jgi:hypothetical protein
MANTSRINGFTVIDNLGSANSGKVNLYYVASAADEILKGDIVKQTSTATADGIMGCDLCGASDVPLGVVVAVLHSKFDPVGKMNSGSTALDLPAAAQIAASGAGYVLVCDDPDVVLEAETSNGTAAITDIGLNVSHANAARTATTVTSPAYIDMGTEATTNTLNFHLMSFVRRIDNEPGNASARVRVRFNVHQLRLGTGSTGV